MLRNIVKVGTLASLGLFSVAVYHTLNKNNKNNKIQKSINDDKKVIEKVAKIQKNHPGRFLDLIQKINDPEHRLSKADVKFFQRYGLMDTSGNIADSIKTIILSSIEGEGFKMTVSQKFSI